MSGDTAIADVGETLIQLLQNHMSDLLQPDMIALLSPSDAISQNVRLALFLYDIQENPYLKNQQSTGIGSSHLQAPPLTLDLYYLLTTYASVQDISQRTLEEHRILGRAMRIIHDNSSLSGSVLQGSLAGTDENLRITTNPISISELTNIWHAIPNTHYRPSVSYVVSPVAIDSSKVIETKRVTVRELDYYQIRGKP